MFLNFNKIMMSLTLMLTLALNACGGGGTRSPLNNQAPHADINNPLNPRTISAPNSSSDLREIDEFFSELEDEICQLAQRCDSSIQINECKRLLNEEGSNDLVENLGLSVEDLNALISALQEGSVTVNERNLELCLEEFDNLCTTSNSNLINGSYENIENVIPENTACNHIFELTGDTHSPSATTPTTTSQTNNTVDNPRTNSIATNAFNPNIFVPIIPANIPVINTQSCPASEQPLVAYRGNIEPVPAPGYHNPAVFEFTDYAQNESRFDLICFESACDYNLGLPQNVNAASTVRTREALSGLGQESYLYSHAFRIGQTYCCALRAITPNCSMNDAQGNIIPFQRAQMQELHYND